MKRKRERERSLSLSLSLSFSLTLSLSLPLSLSLKFKINSSLKIKGKLKKQKPEEVSLQDMMTNEAYAPTQHDRDVFARCVGDFLVKILNKPPSFEAKNTLLPGLRMS